MRRWKAIKTWIRIAWRYRALQVRPCAVPYARPVACGHRVASVIACARTTRVSWARGQQRPSVLASLPDSTCVTGSRVVRRTYRRGVHARFLSSGQSSRAYLSFKTPHTRWSGELGMTDDEDGSLREKVRQTIRAGRLPNRLPDRVWGGPATMRRCVRKAPFSPPFAPRRARAHHHG
jgi:hypothetical protein